jgi:16S rRNA (adenine1518-N6/adenine1519-N6)-dimethyltransferase
MAAPLNYDSPLALRALLDSRGLGMRKKFGQNFLINPAVRKKLTDALELGPGDRVWEIGPGLGAMTRELLDRGALVTAFEIDPGFTDFLREEFGGLANFSLVRGDALKTWKEERPVPFLLGNLPYNIAATLLGDMIEGGRFFRRLVVTVQKEVGRRMAARPGEADYSSFTVLVSGLYHVRPLMTISGSSFFPRPRVDSAGLRLELREEFLPLLTDGDGDAAFSAPEQGTGENTGVPRSPFPPLFYPLVRRLFSCRRKTVKNTLCAFVSSRLGGVSPGGRDSKDLALRALESCGIRPEERPENLDIPQFRDLARQLQYLGVGE